MTDREEKPVRLDKLLSGLGYGSRREITGAIKRGIFCINGEPVTSPEQKFFLSELHGNKLTWEGEDLDPLPPLTVAMNKPCGYVCSHDDQSRRVYDLLPPRFLLRKPRLAVAGRLDKDTSGLLILTDDGDLAHRLISPKKHVPKTYEAELEKPLRGDEKEVFASGELFLKGEDKPLNPAELEIISPQKARVTIYEGRYHQVRRMFASQGNHVIKLHRIAIGGLELGDLEEGACRIPGREEVFAS
jgi:16S rRNA pseudouridine516 synthase